MDVMYHREHGKREARWLKQHRQVSSKDRVTFVEFVKFMRKRVWTPHRPIALSTERRHDNLFTDPGISIDPQIITRVASFVLATQCGGISASGVGSSARTSDLLLVDFEGVTVLHIELIIKVSFGHSTTKTEQVDETYSVW